MTGKSAKRRIFVDTDADENKTKKTRVSRKMRNKTRRLSVVPLPTEKDGPDDNDVLMDSGPPSSEVSAPSRPSSPVATPDDRMKVGPDDESTMKIAGLVGDEIEDESDVRNRAFTAFMSRHFAPVVVGSGSDASGLSSGRCDSHATKTRPGMTVGLLVIDVMYREKRSDKSPTGPVITGLVVPRTISFRGVGFGELSSQKDGNHGMITRKVREKMSPEDRSQRIKDGKKDVKYSYKVVGNTEVVAGSMIMAVDVYAGSDALGNSGQQFKRGDVVMCHGVRLETRISDPVAHPKGYTSYSAKSITEASDDIKGRIDMSALTNAKPTEVFLSRPVKDQQKWKEAERVIMESGMDIDLKTRTSLMRNAMSSATQQILGSEMLFNTMGTSKTAMDELKAANRTVGVMHKFNKMEFPPADYDRAWRRTKDKVDVPCIIAYQIKSQFDCGVAFDKTNGLYGHTAVHIKVSVPTKHTGAFGITDPSVALDVLPRLVPKIDTSFNTFVDIGGTLDAHQNLLGTGVACSECISTPGRDLYIDECCAYNYIAKMVFPKLLEGLDRAAADASDLHVFKVSLEYAREFLKSTHRTMNMGSSAYGKRWSEEYERVVTDKRVINVAESTHDFGDQTDLRWREYTFFVVYGFNHKSRDIRELEEARLHEKSGKLAGKFLFKTMGYHENTAQAVFAVKLPVGS